MRLPPTTYSNKSALVSYLHDQFLFLSLTHSPVVAIRTFKPDRSFGLGIWRAYEPHRGIFGNRHIRNQLLRVPGLSEDFLFLEGNACLGFQDWIVHGHVSFTWRVQSSWHISFSLYFILFFFIIQCGSRAGSDPASFREINMFFFPPLIVLDLLLLFILIEAFLRSILVHMVMGRWVCR
jgi:hypothetical protein